MSSRTSNARTDASSGTKLWESRYDSHGPAGGSDFAYALGVSPDGSRVFVTGSSVGLGSWIDYATVAIDAFTGRTMGVRKYDGPVNDTDFAIALGVSPDGPRCL